MTDENKPDFNLEVLELGSYTTKLYDEDHGQTGYVQNEDVNIDKFPKYITEPQALFGGDPLLIDTIFISADDRIKSIGK